MRERRKKRYQTHGQTGATVGYRGGGYLVHNWAGMGHFDAALYESNIGERPGYVSSINDLSHPLHRVVLNGCRVACAFEKRSV